LLCFFLKNKERRTYDIKLFTDVNNVFVTVSHFHASLILVRKARSSPLGWRTFRDSTLVGSKTLEATEGDQKARMFVSGKPFRSSVM
jgi:hypothetical protein